MMRKEQTRTPKTIQNYLERAERLLRTIPDEFLRTPELGVQPTEIVAWLSQTAPGILKSTFRQYKAALVCYMETLARRYPDAAEDYTNAILAIRQISSAQAARRKALPARTSASKAKHVHLDDLVLLGQTMLAVNTQWSHRAFIWLAAGIAAGLRPAEWQTVEILGETEGGELILRAANAKHTNGRGNGEFRDITIPPGWMREYTEQHLRMLGEWLAGGEPYDSYYNTCRQTLLRAVRALWPDNSRKRYTLYSARHQFCANLKRAGVSKGGIAAKMGHASEKTATEHYGKRRSGHSSLVIQAGLPSVRNLPSLNGKPLGPG